MSGALVSLGGVTLEAFEVPSLIHYGGRQQLVIHQMIGGGRVIDCLGPNASLIRWPGVFSGPNGGDRARTLDAMRSAGGNLLLSWDAYCYNVVIDTLDLQYRMPWWIEYQISCAVIADLSQPAAAAPETLLASIEADLGLAGQYADVAGASAAIAAPAFLTKGTASYATAGSALSAASAGVFATIAASEAGLSSSSLPIVVGSAGALAQGLMATLYLGRAATNLENASQ